jgi:hypothetical protein
VRLRGTDNLSLAELRVFGDPAPAWSPPVGWLDGADTGNSGRIFGWALDQAVPSTSIDVHIYFDRGTDRQRVYGVTTNVYRPDVNAVLGVSGNHGFDFAIPRELFDGTQHTVDVFGIDPHGVGNPLLLGCPKYFTHLPEAPTLVSPSGNTYQAIPVLSWTASTGATQYWVQIDDIRDPGVAVRVFQGIYNTAQVCFPSGCWRKRGTSRRG